MNKVFMQLWEESERGWGTRPDGCSLHLSIEEKIIYINNVYNSRNNLSTPDEYDRVVGSEIEVFIEDSLYESIKFSKSVRLFEHELNNLFSLEEIIIKDK